MARILANTKDMPREEWLKLRRTGFGSSKRKEQQNVI